MSRVLLADLEADPRRVDALLGDLTADPVEQSGIEHGLVRHLDEDEVEFLPIAEGDGGGDDPAVDGPHEIVASRRGHELTGRRFVALLVDHPEDRIVVALGRAADARDAEVHEAETILDESGLDLVHP